MLPRACRHPSRPPPRSINASRRQYRSITTATRNGGRFGSSVSLNTTPEHPLLASEYRRRFFSSFSYNMPWTTIHHPSLVSYHDHSKALFYRCHLRVSCMNTVAVVSCKISTGWSTVDLLARKRWQSPIYVEPNAIEYDQSSTNFRNLYRSILQVRQNSHLHAETLKRVPPR